MVSLDVPDDTKSDRLTLPVSIQRLTMLLAIAVLRLIMDYSYNKYLSPENASENHFYNFLNMEKMYVSWVLMVGCALFLPVTARKPSDFLLFVLFIFPVMGMLSLFAFLDGDPVYAYFTAASFIIIATMRNVRLFFPLTQFKGTINWAVPAVFLTVAAVAMGYYISLGMGSFQLNIMKVYDVRLELTEKISQSTFLSYVGTWCWTVFTTFLIAWAISQKRWFTLAFLLLLQVYFFGATSAKTVLAFPCLVFLTYWLLRPGRSLTWLVYFVIGIVCIGIIEELVSTTYLWNHVIVRRVLWDPARTNWLYHDLFSKIGHVYMSENILKPLIPYPFPLDPPHLVGLETYGRADANADTGFLGTSDMHFGPAGMILYAVIIGFLFRLCDMLTVGRMKVWIGAAIIIGPFYALYNDSDLPTSLLTHGLAPAIFILFLYGHFPAERLKRLAARFHARTGNVPAR